MKKIVSIFLALIFTLSIVSVLAFADNESVDAKLRFDNNGEFNVLYICDCQDGYPAHEEMFAYINYMLGNYKIDIVVLGGDNTVCGLSDEEKQGLSEDEIYTAAVKQKEDAIAQLVKPFVEHEVYFTMVFGNHDHQQGVDKKTLFDIYTQAGGEYFLGFNEDKADSDRVGTHCLPIYASESDDVKYALYMFDSGNYIDDGYDSVNEDQIAWYKEKRDSLKEENGGYVPSIAFQHIIVGDVYDFLYYESPVDLGELGRTFYGKHYTFVPKLLNFTGFINEPPCPGEYNRGQLDAIAEKGDMRAIFSGHDHTNDFDVEIKGVHVVNTPSITYNSYSSELNRGARLITLHENGDQENKVITINSIAMNDGDFAKQVGTSKFAAGFYEFMAKFLLAVGKVFSVFGYIFK